MKPGGAPLTDERGLSDFRWMFKILPDGVNSHRGNLAEGYLHMTSGPCWPSRCTLYLIPCVCQRRGTGGLAPPIHHAGMTAERCDPTRQTSRKRTHFFHLTISPVSSSALAEDRVSAKYQLHKPHRQRDSGAGAPRPDCDSLGLPRGEIPESAPRISVKTGESWLGKHFSECCRGVDVESSSRFIKSIIHAGQAGQMH